ncbi:MAG: HAD-IA family hydrolase [Gemmatimonadota bacterium]
MTARLRTVLFDLDGTLVDSRDLILGSYRHVMRVHRGRELADERWLATMGRPLTAQLSEFARDEDEAAAMLATYLTHNRATHEERIRSFPGVREVLGRLAGDGYVLGIVSSKSSDGIRLALRSCALPTEWFRVVIGSDNVDRHKPDPQPILAALAAVAEVEPARAVYVGDSIHDLLAGRAAGTRTAAALWGPFDRSQLEPGEPDYWLEGIGELEAILDGSR